MEIVLSHVQSDFDALAATVAASKLRPGAIPVLQTQLNSAVRELIATHKDALRLVDLVDIDPALVTHVTVVDTRSSKRLGEVFTALDRPDVTWEVYDHHPPGPDELPASPGRREAMGAAATLVVELLAARNLTLTPLEATVVALGIYADTGRLTFPSTTAADVRAAAWLLEQGADLEIIGRYVEEELSDEQRALMDDLVASAEPRVVHGQSVLVVGARTLDYVGGVATVTHKLIALFDVDVIVVVAELGPKRTQFVGRARIAAVDLRAALAEWAPQGHPRAVSAHTKGLPFEEGVARVWERLALAIPPEPTAADLMSCPVRTIAPNAPVSAARKALLDFGHNGLVVMAESELVGVISRRDLDRATRHGLQESLVAHVMARRVIVTEPEASLSAIEALFVEHDVGRLPVMRGDALVGIVTRQDVLRAKYDHDPARRAAVGRQTSALADRLAAMWPADWLSIIDRLGEAAGDRPVYLVGGAVRDLLLGRSNLDVDLVVEGDGIAFAREAATHFADATVKVHPTFGTAHILLPGGKCIDVASARTEHYERPAALPTVAFSTIKQDLARRDFSVNCLAMRIDLAARGELIDFFGARGDLHRRSLRVLHNLSFIEDPTRVLRAVRFEQQLGFALDAASEAFARHAMNTGTFDGIGGERNKMELRRLLSLPDVIAVLERLHSLGALRLLDPTLSPPFAYVARARDAAENSADAWLAALYALLGTLPVATAEGLADRLNLDGTDRHTAHALPLARNKLAAGLPNIEVVDLMKGLAPAGQAVLAAEFPAARWYLETGRHVSLTVNGDDLRKMGLAPGPLYAQILRTLLAERLAGLDPAAELERLAALNAAHQQGS